MEVESDFLVVVAERLGVDLAEGISVDQLDEASVARASTAELPRDGIPLAASAQSIDDSREGLSVIKSTGATQRTPSPRRNPLLHALPKVIRHVGVVGLHGQVDITPASRLQIIDRS